MKKDKKVKEVVVTAPSKIVSVVFTIPTSFSYESVKVEITGIEDNDELVSKYNELVGIFRPASKSVAPKAPMAPYSVHRKIPAADDEAGGAVIRDDTPDKNTITLQRLDIVSLLEEKHGFMCKGISKEEFSNKVLELTGLVLAEENYPDIIDALKK